MLLLGHLHLQNGDASAALAASTHGLEALRQRRHQGWEVSEAMAAQMLLLNGQSLLAAGRLAEASKALNAVAGRCSMHIWPAGLLCKYCSYT